jgi:hypothetical protein
MLPPYPAGRFVDRQHGLSGALRQATGGYSLDSEQEEEQISLNFRPAQSSR